MRHLLPRGYVLLFGALGLVLVARAAAFYRASDAFAFGLVLLIGAGLLLGLGELFVRATESARLSRELEALPRPATFEAIEAASPSLRALLRARLGGMAASPQAAAFTPYLLGLLVMIGMLGTFMGLFETLRGAREALTASGDVEALRSGLAAPMSGLSRAFGTSAAGVSASATLGLAAVFVRRAEGGFVRQLLAYVAGPLSPLTLAGRQLTALEALAKQGEALPVAAEALRATTARIEALEAKIVASHEASAAAAAAAILSAAKDVGAQIDAGIGRATESMGAKVAPLLDRAVERAGAVAGEGLAGFTKRLDADAEARRRESTAHLARSEAELARAREAAAESAAELVRRDEARTAALGARLSAIAEATSEAAARLERDERARAEALRVELGVLVETITAKLERSAEADGARLRALDDAAASMQARFDADAEARTRETTAHLGRAEAELARAREAVAESAAELVRRDEARAAALGVQLSAIADATTAAAARLERDERARAEALRVELGAVVEAVTGKLAQSAEADGARLRALDDAAARMQSRLDASAAVAAAQGEALSERLAGHVGALDRVLEVHLRTLGEGLAAPLAEVARAAALAPEAATRLVELAGERLASRERADDARDARVGELLRELAAHAAEMREAGTRQAEALAGTARDATERAHASESRAEERLLAVTMRVEAVLDRQAAAQIELEARLEKARGATAESLAAELATHARSLGQGLEGTSARVREAADLLRSGTGEMAAVAEMFTLAVDRYREASDKWQDGLLALEDASARKGEADAIELVGSYVNQTREVFEHSIELQRELFAELRALRTGSRDSQPAPKAVR